LRHHGKNSSQTEKIQPRSASSQFQGPSPEAQARQAILIDRCRLESPNDGNLPIHGQVLLLRIPKAHSLTCSP
jgi:hypothetical protein